MKLLMLPRDSLLRLASLERGLRELSGLLIKLDNALLSTSNVAVPGSGGAPLARTFASVPPQQPVRQGDREDTFGSDPSEYDRRRTWRESLPSLEQVTDRLRSGRPPATDCSSSAAPLPTPSEEETGGNEGLNWQEVIERARASAASIEQDRVLTDTFGRKHTYLRISLTERCNLRCLYCMPEEGVALTPRAELLTVAEIERLMRLFAAAGITKVRLTGGEPTLRPDLPDIVRRVAAISGVKDVGLTTNGLTLSRTLPTLRDAGLSLLNISLDTLRPDRFERMTRRRGHSRVLEAIQSAVRLGYDPVKVNVVVMRGVNDDEIGDFVELTRRDPVNVRFIEYMPFDGNVWSRDKLVPYREMMEAVLQRHGGDAVPVQRCDDPTGEVAKNFRLQGHRGQVSFVTSMTSAFCGDCNRLRLMADGNLKVCLFGANEVSLRDAMRGGATDADLLAVISVAVDRKKAAHAGMFELARSKNRAMVKIGG